MPNAGQWLVSFGKVFPPDVVESPARRAVTVAAQVDRHALDGERHRNQNHEDNLRRCWKLMASTGGTGIAVLSLGERIMPNIPIQHKTQTRANDCWYACIQMLRTYRAGKKSKPDGAGVRAHRNEKMLFNWELVWGHKLGDSDPQFHNILKSNNLIDVGKKVLLSDAGWIQQALDEHGPLMVLGDFFSIGPKVFGHWIVITGTAPNEKVHIHDPAWTLFGGGERKVKISWLKTKQHRGSPVIANHPAAWE